VNAFIRLPHLVFACVVTVALAADPPPATDKPAAAASPPRIVLEDKTLTNDEIRQLFAQGYKPVSRDGEVYYCRREAEIGSRIATMHCKTAEQMKQITRDSKDLLGARQKTGGCGAGIC